MATKFQKNPSLSLLKEIVRTFHPKLPEEAVEKLKFTTKYNWICIGFSVKDYGFISIGICNHSVIDGIIIGPISKDYAKDAIKNNRIGCRVWRFFDDKYFKDDSYIQAGENLQFTEKIPKPSAEEYYEYYMRD